MGQSSITTVGTISSGTWSGSVVGASYGGTGVANTGTITLGGNLTTSGAFTTTFIVTNNTSVTLPTSGTLVNSAVTSLSSLATVGTIVSGIWQGTAIGSSYGGAGTINGLVKANGSGVTSLASSTTDYVAQGTTSTLTVGYAATPSSQGTKSSGTFTPSEANGCFQYATNGGAHTLAPPSNNTTIVLDYVNNGSAGAITTSGFTKVNGDSFDTTNGHTFRCFISKNQQGSLLSVVALQ